jgi:[ribosomal protein S18]-alanine N-acetyltransferase
MTAKLATTAIVRRAGLVNADAIAAIHASSFARAWDAASMAQFLAAPSCLCLIASSAPDTLPQGFLIARIAGDEAELLTLAVEPAHRQQGLAAALLAEAMRQLRAAGAKQLFLEVERGNTSALRLYDAFGAVRVGRRKAYYEHGADAAIFSLAL